jgi:RNA polymerase sigma-70 factor (ECF subfamily)
VRRCRAGDPAAQRELFRAQRHRVHHILYRVLGSNREMEDALQEAWLAIYRSLRTYRGDCSLATWVDRVSTRSAYRFLSRQASRRVPTVHLEAVPPIGDEKSDPGRQLYLRQAARRLYGYLDRLPPPHRIAYALHVVDGRPLREVATLTDSSLSAVKSRVARTRKRLERWAEADPLLSELVDSGRQA